ncbi:MAG: lactate utilization protein [Gammaproteobacteria bacterium]|uniref:LutC/YkgG family protein n=1 Tax=Rhodoferax sp. TaxID=50421 RepID=UPI0017F6601E|nr:LUD domain-containing protein [Rhodoferax sp.]MBU3897438.1 lactate utilization protein [Gammaproteobacteria bacterium]MBA3056940.1 lactate utilization protein C [Rhodoferax sp.]MBU3998485.1 lactate utilization protein [Gammaproteobacteria bacterium]MBU4018784.1 lactate utilization protein [Gammaproteobacteria bacterium]MBU4079739.1 lactate utilization protein [Gammaproteobacteria bacterium]
MSARDSILARLRATPIAQTPPLPDVKAWFDAHRRNENLAQRVARLRAALEAVKSEVHDVSATDWPEVLLRIAAAKGLRNLLIGTDTTHGAALQACQPENLQLIRYTDSIDSWRDALFDDIDASLTLAKSAIAEIGSLILWPDASEPRLMSLVPSVHFVLLDVGTIHSDLHSAITTEGWKDGLPTNALLICGPSKTADIQQTLAYGAHGPRELVVLLRHAENADQGAAA